MQIIITIPDTRPAATPPSAVARLELPTPRRAALRVGTVVRHRGTDEIDRGRVIAAGQFGPNQHVTVTWASGYTDVDTVDRLQRVRFRPDQAFELATTRYASARL